MFSPSRVSSSGCRPCARGTADHLDTTFGGDGRVITNIGRRCDSLRTWHIQANGKIVQGPCEHPSIRSFALAATERTAPSTHFGGDGLVFIDFAGRPNAAFGVAIQQDGRSSRSATSR